MQVMYNVFWEIFLNENVAESDASKLKQWICGSELKVSVKLHKAD